jgi:hypothetical protein
MLTQKHYVPCSHKNSTEKNDIMVQSIASDRTIAVGSCVRGRDVSQASPVSRSPDLLPPILKGGQYEAFL